MPDYGEIEQVKKMLRPNESASYGADVDARLIAIQRAVSRRLEHETGRTFGASVADTTRLVWAGPIATLLLPYPARAITSVTVGGTVAGGTMTGGTAYASSLWAHDPLDGATGLIYGLRLLSGAGWGSNDGFGRPLMPVQVVADFADSDDDAGIPDDVTYWTNYLILRTYQAEATGVAGVAGEDGSFRPPLDPWKHPSVKSLLAKYGPLAGPVL